MPPRTARMPLALALVALALTACSGGSAAPAAAPAPVSDPSIVVASPTASAAPATAAPSPSASATPSASASPAAPAFRYDVTAVQTRLQELRYYGGAVDGRAGSALRSAVMAFQKVNGLGADGSVGPKTLAALKAPKAPVLRGSAPADRVEVDLTRQVLYVVKRGAISRILPVSSGNGARYSQKNGSTARALTPTGYYKIQRRIVGERNADLGTLYDPQYFYKGWAIHGSNSVPAYPASHGCVRVTRADAKYLLRVIGIGTTVYLYGGTHVFTAGSSAPGTDTPTGDTAAPAPSPTRTTTSPSPTRAPSPAPSPTRAPSPSASPSPSPTATP